MDRNCYQRRYREAMFKAVTAKSGAARAAYYDLAAFYEEKLANAPLLQSAA